MTDSPTLILVLTSAAISALNPYTIGVLILLISMVLGRGHAKGRMFTISFCYIVALFLTSYVVGALLASFLQWLPSLVASYLAIGIGLFIVAAGILEIKDYFWYGRSISLRIPLKAAERIKAISKKNVGLAGAALLGMFVAIVALPNTSAPYLATITILKDHSLVSTLGLLLLYNIVFVLPMLALLFLVAGSTKISAIQRWKEENKGAMRLGVGLLLIALGWVIILISSGVVNFG